MKAMFLAALVALTLGSAPVMAQAPLLGYWKTSAECTAGKNTPFYHPSIVHQRKLAANEVIRGHPTGGCFDLDLPDRFGGRGWVRIEAGREFVYNIQTGEYVRLTECNNNNHGWVPFPEPVVIAGAQGLQGLKGDPGPIGPQGPTGRDAPLPQEPIIWPKEGGGISALKVLGIIAGAAVVAGGTYLIVDKLSGDGGKKGPKAITGPAFQIRF